MDTASNRIITLSDADQSILKTLASANVDSAQLFKTASDETSDQQLKVFFGQGAHSRTRFADEFKHLLAITGSEPASQGSLAGFIHNWWIDIRELLTHHESHAIIDETLRGEESLKSAYEDTFSKIHSQELKQVIERHYAEIKEVTRTLEELRTEKRPDRHE